MSTLFAPESTEQRTDLQLRIASILCWIVGLISAYRAFSIGIPALHNPPRSALPLIQGLVASALIIGGAVLVQRARRLGGILVLIATLAPSFILLLSQMRLRPPPLFLLIAALAVLANWKRLE